MAITFLLILPLSYHLQMWLEASNLSYSVPYLDKNILFHKARFYLHVRLNTCIGPGAM